MIGLWPETLLSAPLDTRHRAWSKDPSMRHSYPEPAATQYFDSMARVIRNCFPHFTDNQYRYACNKASNLIRQCKQDVCGVAISAEGKHYIGAGGCYYAYQSFLVGPTRVYIRIAVD